MSCIFFLSKSVDYSTVDFSITFEMGHFVHSHFAVVVGKNNEV